MKKIIYLAMLFLILASIHSVDLTRPDDPIYRDLEYWQERGYYGHLPPLRPYPTQLVEELLQIVIDKGNDHDVEQATRYLERIQGRFNIHFMVQGEGNLSDRGLQQSYGGLRARVNGYFSPNLSYWGELAGNGVIRYEEDTYYTYMEAAAYGERPFEDFIDDAGQIAGITLMSSFRGMMSYGDSGLYLNSGIYPSSFGPFWGDSIVLSSEAFQQGHIDLVWWQDKFSFTQAFLGIVGSNNLGDDKFAEKYAVIRSYNWAPYSWAEISFFETVVWGGRFEPLYLLPFNYLFYMQGYIGFRDNSLMGLSARAQLPYDLELNGIIYTDDLGFNDLVKFNFDTKLKLAYDLGISWSPEYHWLQKLEMNYTAVMPYMYTHSDWKESKAVGGPNAWDQFNIDNYTHLGENLGVTLSPNSDRVRLNVVLTPKEDVHVSVGGTYIRHGNSSVRGSKNLPDPSEALSGGTDVPNDGTIFDSGIDEDGNLYFQDENRFLSQDVLEQVLQFGVMLDAEIPMPAMDLEEHYRMRALVGLTYEWIWNSGRDSAYGYQPVKGNDESNYYFKVGLCFIF